MSKVLREMCKLLQTSQVRTSGYHPQTDNLVERFTQTLKGMLRKMIEEDGTDWDQLLPYLLFAIGEAPQSSMGFAPFELLNGRRPEAYWTSLGTCGNNNNPLCSRPSLNMWSRWSSSWCAYCPWWATHAGRTGTAV